MPAKWSERDFCGKKTLSHHVPPKKLPVNAFVHPKYKKLTCPALRSQWSNVAMAKSVFLDPKAKRVLFRQFLSESRSVWV